jgi:dTDP-4-amino-4,6-dideoxy-D-glucose/dTDP-4-amino-2,4-dideoxy-beta-L-xylose transaminase
MVLTNAASVADDSRERAAIIDDPWVGTTPTSPVALFRVAMSEHAPERVGDVLRSGYIGQGPRVEQFEAALAARLGTDRIVTLNSATSGLHLAWHLLANTPAADGRPIVSDGDEVLAPALTCTATNWPALANRLRLRWVDADPATCNVDLDDLAARLGPETRAVMIVHWGGYPVDLARLGEILDAHEQRHGFRPAVIEDCAHGWSSTYQGLPLGNHGNFAVFSFQAIKHLTTGDGGLLVSPNDDWHRRAKLMRWYGIDRENNERSDFRCEADIPEWGFKFHMNDIAAATGLANLEIIDEVVARHRAHAAAYDHAFADVDGLTVLERAADRDSAFWIYTMRAERRDDLMRKLGDAGIASSRVHERNDIHSCVAAAMTSLPQLDRLVTEMICIPVGWWVTPAQRDHVIDTIRSGW